MKQRFETFTVLINRINRNIRKIKNQEMVSHSLRSPHVSCLYYLYTQTNLTATDLCERCEEDKATISRSLEYLETNGYLICQDCGVKRYKSHFQLTKKGLIAGKEISDKINNILDRISVGLTEEERVAFYRSLTVISNSLDAIANKFE